MHILWLICTPTSRQTLVSGRDMESCGFCHPPPPYPLLPCNRCPIWVPASQTAPKLGPLATSGVMMLPMWWKSLVERSVSHGTFVASFKARQCRSVTEDPLCPPLTLSHSCVQHSSTILSRSYAVKLSEDNWRGRYYSVFNQRLHHTLWIHTLVMNQNYWFQQTHWKSNDCKDRNLFQVHLHFKLINNAHAAILFCCSQWWNVFIGFCSFANAFCGWQDTFCLSLSLNGDIGLHCILIYEMMNRERQSCSSSMN